MKKPRINLKEFTDGTIGLEFDTPLTQREFESIDGWTKRISKQERERIIKLLEDNHLTTASELIQEEMS